MKQRRPVSTTPTEASTSNPLALRIQRLVTLDNHVEYRVMRVAFPVKTFSSYDEAKAYVARQQAQS